MCLLQRYRALKLTVRGGSSSPIDRARAFVSSESLIPLSFLSCYLCSMQNQTINWAVKVQKRVTARLRVDVGSRTSLGSAEGPSPCSVTKSRTSFRLLCIEATIRYLLAQEGRMPERSRKPGEQRSGSWYATLLGIRVRRVLLSLSLPRAVMPYLTFQFETSEQETSILQSLLLLVLSSS